jgi:hypothetical protein
VSRPDHREAPPIERRQLDDAEAFRGRHHRCIDRAEREIRSAASTGSGIRLPEARSPRKPNLGLRPETGSQEIGHLGHDRFGHDQRPRVIFEQPQARLVVGVVLVDVGVERSRVDDQRDRRASSRRISSMRRAVSR